MRKDLLLGTKTRTLIFIECAGADPWLTIEEFAQRPILEAWFGDESDLVWISGTNDPEGNDSQRPGVRHLRRQLKLTGRVDSAVSRALRVLVSEFNLHAFGELKARKFFYNRFGDSVPKIDGRRVTLPFPTQIHIAGLRTIETFKFVLENYEFDYAVRLSSTCLIRPETLRSLVKNLPQSRVFGGTQAPFGRTSFISGASSIFSRDVLEGIVKNERKFLLSVYEDVAISLLVKRLGLAEVIDFPRIDLTSRKEIPLGIKEWSDIPVIRCKAESPTRSPQKVIQNMLAVKNFVDREQ